MLLRTVLAVFLLTLATGSSQAAPAARRLSLEDRLAAVEAIERVFWSHRTWPEQNPGPKPAFEEVFSREALRVKVEDALRLSSAVERLWDRPITQAQLQAELDRIVAGTKQPAVLREIFAALGDDPQLIAECVARPILAERIARSSYARDVRFHETVRRAAEAAATVARTPQDLNRLGGEYFEQTRGSQADAAAVRPGAARTVALDEDAWQATRKRLAARFRAPGTPAIDDQPLPIGRVSRLREDDDTFSLLTVLSDSGTSVATATAVWRKTPFESWWRSARSGFGYDVEEPTGPYSLGSPEAGCTDGTWSAMRYEVPDPRFNHTAVWTGTEMIVWGGEDDFVVETGGRYNPATDSWTLTSMTNVPFSRSRHTAVWTGSEMIVWGGFHPYASLADGGRYNPATDQWTPTSTGANVPTGRQDHTAVWTGTEMIVWGGINETTFERFNTGGRYNPATDSWAATTTTAAPPGRDLHTAVWTGSVMIVFGGNNASLQYLTAGSRYNPATNSWSAIPAIPSSGRVRHTAVWSGTEMIVFGGYNGVGYLNSGGRYNPATNSWTLTSVGAGVPTGRAYHTAVWTGSQMVVHGGYDGTNYLASGGRYSPATDTWLPTSTVGAEAPRLLHTAVWNGTEMLVWGGVNEWDYLVRGGRYDPAADSWVLMGAGSTVPPARYYHEAVWTGSEMLVMGGFNEYFTPDSWRYVPATDTWTSAGVGNGDRFRHLAIWTGREAIVWGGYDLVGALATGARFDPTASTWTPTGMGPDLPAARGNLAGVWDGSRLVLWGGWDGIASGLGSGGIYDPKTDAWAPMSSTGAPSPRAAHVAIWTGTEMVVWGGTPDATAALSTGGRYRPATDNWEPTSTTDAPSGRWNHKAVWTGSRMVLQGGYDGVAWLGTGSRYDPVGDTWYPAANFASARVDHTAVWTGSDVLVWGGWNGSSNLSSGSRYDPATDAFSSIPFGGLSTRSSHSAVWTGERMVVWGGFPSTSTGSAYCSVPSCPVVPWFRDADGDAFGNGTDTVLSCVQPLGYVTAAGDCDDAVAAANPSASEACDGLDNDCNAVVDDVVRPGAVASVVSLRSGEAVTISWDAAAGAQTYDVVRGQLGLLGSTGGDFTSSVSGCLGNDLQGTSVVDPDAPEAGNGFWHLVRGANCGGSGTYDEASPGQVGTRDGEILAAPGACP